MADDNQSASERNLPPSQRRLQKARDAGNLPISREAAAFAAFGAAALILAFLVPTTSVHAIVWMKILLGRAFDSRLVHAGFYLAARNAALVCFPVLAVAAVVGSAAILAQTRMHFRLAALKPSFSRVSPVSGLKRIFGSQGLIEAAKSILKLIVLCVVLLLSLRSSLPQLLQAPFVDPHSLSRVIVKLVSNVLMVGLIAGLGFALGDILLVRYRYVKSLRMNRRDMLDEYKETEGNPHTKARIKRIRVTRGRQQMMAKVPQATVVVTNPTHYAVALAYERSANPAPKVVAKGADDVAARIRDLANEHRVPIVANPPLARALFTVPLDAEIPAEHYRAVAEVIAYVWRLKMAAEARKPLS